MDRPSAGARWLDSIALFFLMCPAVLGSWLLGSTRVWGFSLGLTLGFIGAALMFVRVVLIRGTPRLHIPFCWICMAVASVYAAGSAPFASVPAAARWDALKWLCLCVVTFAWIQVGGKGNRWKWLLGVLMLAVAVECLYAIQQAVTHSDRVLWMARPEQYGSRASGTFLCPNHLAALLAMLFPVSVALLLTSAAGLPLRILSVYFLLLSAPVLYWTKSRSGWGGMVAGIYVTLVLMAGRKSRRLCAVALVGLPLLFGALGVAVYHSLPFVHERIGAVLEDPVKAGGIRMEMWRDMPGMIRERPVVGFGGGSFVWAYPPFQRHTTLHHTWDYLHNEYLQVMVEYGAIGVGLLLLTFVAFALFVFRGVRAARGEISAALLAAAAGALATALLQAVFDFNFHIFPLPHALLWILGVAVGVWMEYEGGNGGLSAVHPRARAILAAIAVLGCGVCAWLATAGGVSYFENLKGDVARTNLEWDVAETAYRKAIRWQPGNSQPWAGLGQLNASKALWWRDMDLDAERAQRKVLADAAMENFRQARLRNPCDMSILFGVARTYNTVNDPASALEQLRRAAEYQHRHVFYREQVGIQLRRMGRDDEALQVFRDNVTDGVAGNVSRLNIRTLERKLSKKSATVSTP